MTAIHSTTTDRKAATVASATTPKASTIERFCLDHSISKAFFYKLLKLGQGPRTMKVGSRQLISEEAAREWREDRTQAA